MVKSSIAKCSILLIHSTVVWSGYTYQTICLIRLHGTNCRTIAWPWVFKVESCLWLRIGFLGSNPASGYVGDFQGRILVTLPNITTSLHRQGFYLGHGTKCNSYGLARHQLSWSCTKCDTMFWARLLFVTLTFGYGTKCNNILARRHCNNNAVTTTSAKCNTVVYDNTCTKYKNDLGLFW